MKKVWLTLLCAVVAAAALVFVNGGGTAVRVSAAAQRPDYYEPPVSPARPLIQVLVNGVPREIYHGRGRSYVEALRGEEYELRIRNPFPVRVAVALSVDGLNTIDARRTTRQGASKWVVEPYQTVTISGWQVSGERARRFYFTSERDSYASKLGRPSDLGVISAAFYRERQAGGGVITRPYPSGEPRAKDEMRRDSEEGESSDYGRKSENRPQNRPPQSGTAQSGQPQRRMPAPEDDDYAATGIGRSVHHDVRWTHLDLEARPAAEVMLRYEYREALVRLGIFPRPYYEPDPLRRRERSTGFEDQRYSPEP